MENKETRNIEYELIKRTLNLEPESSDYYLVQLTLVKLFEKEKNYNELIENFSSEVQKKINYSPEVENKEDFFDKIINTYNELIKNKASYEDYLSSLEIYDVDLTGLEKKLSLPEENRTNMDNNCKSCGNREMESMN